MIQEPITDQHGEAPSVERGKALSSTALLAAWRRYTENPHAKHPCENFKAGWVANQLMQTDSETTGDSKRVIGCVQRLVLPLLVRDAIGYFDEIFHGARYRNALDRLQAYNPNKHIAWNAGKIIREYFRENTEITRGMKGAKNERA